MAERHRKVLHIIKGLGRGGAERLLVSTIKQHGKDYHFDVVYYLPSKCHLVEELRSLGCIVFLIPSPNVLLMLLQLPKLIRFIRQHQYDLIHAHLPWSGIVARIAGKITGVPVVYTEHNLFNRYNVITRLFSRLTFSWQAQVIAVSDRVAESLHRLVKPSVPVRVIMNGVDVAEFRKPVGKGDVTIDNEQLTIDNHKIDNVRWKLPEGVVVIGTVTALTVQKRMDRWIAIAEEVSRAVPEAYFVIVGDGVLREEIEKLGASLVKENKLMFAGMTSEPARWLHCFDIFLMSSDFEGLPVALLEAMSMECVPIATHVGGVPTVITHGETGYLFEPDQPQEAVKIILDLVKSRADRARIATAARQVVVEKFSVVRMVEELEEVYGEYLTGWENEKV